MREEEVEIPYYSSSLLHLPPLPLGTPTLLMAARSAAHFCFTAVEALCLLQVLLYSCGLCELPRKRSLSASSQHTL
jgi:hypothetical protein